MKRFFNCFPSLADHLQIISKVDLRVTLIIIFQGLSEDARKMQARSKEKFSKAALRPPSDRGLGDDRLGHVKQASGRWRGGG